MLRRPVGQLSCSRPTGWVAEDRFGSWLCKNAKTLNRDRRNYSSKTALVAQLASEFNLEVELKNIILVAFRFFERDQSFRSVSNIWIKK